MLRKSVTASILCLLMLSQANCALTGLQRPASDECLDFEPVYLHAGDVISPETGKPILANNNVGHVKCQWPYADRAAVESMPDNHLGTMTN